MPTDSVRPIFATLEQLRQEPGASKNENPTGPTGLHRLLPDGRLRPSSAPAPAGPSAAPAKTLNFPTWKSPGHMPKMTMELSVHAPAELAGITAGDEITFRRHTTAIEERWGSLSKFAEDAAHDLFVRGAPVGPVTLGWTRVQAQRWLRIAGTSTN